MTHKIIICQEAFPLCQQSLLFFFLIDRFIFLSSFRRSSTSKLQTLISLYLLHLLSSIAINMASCQFRICLVMLSIMVLNLVSHYNRP